MEGEVINGVLHGKVLIRGKANTLIFSGKYDNEYHEDDNESEYDDGVLHGKVLVRGKANAVIR